MDGATAGEPSDPRLEALVGMVGRAGARVCWLARLATRASLVGALAGGVLWWAVAGGRLDEWWRGTAGSMLVLLLCLAPALWLLNVRFALHDLVELPEKLSGVASRRSGRLRGRPAAERPNGGALAAVRSIRDIFSDYGDVAGSWGTVAQLVVPTFWVLTVAALAAVPVLVMVAAIAASIFR